LKLIPRVQPRVQGQSSGPSSFVSQPLSRDSVGVDGTAMKLPGSVETFGCFGSMLQAAGDAVQLVPFTRWTPMEGQCDQAAFMFGVQHFDNGFFGISPIESEMMDPQQRLLLEVGYEALHTASQRRSALSRSTTGVHVAIEHMDWQMLQLMATTQTAMQRASAFAASGEQGHVASGRLAFVFDLQGPTMSINTACSSGIVCAHLSSAALRAGESELGLAPGVKVMLVPFRVGGGVLATDGRSKSFDARGDGYGRSEATAAIVLSLNETSAASLAGVAIQSGGRGASLTAPNGTGQSKAIARAISSASILASEIGCVQAQGLGSALADPIEVNAALAVYGDARQSQLVVSSHKANIGHSEASSGLIGSLAALYALQYSSAGNGHLRLLNPLIAQQARRMPAPTIFGVNQLTLSGTSTCGVTAFGSSGIIGHALLSVKWKLRDPTKVAAPA